MAQESADPASHESPPSPEEIGRIVGIDNDLELANTLAQLDQQHLMEHAEARTAELLAKFKKMVGRGILLIRPNMTG